jgi:hypothetical protein
LTGAKPKRRRSAGVVVRVAQAVVPKLPHERDESPERKTKPPEKVILKAAADLASGRQDTDRGPQTNRLARKLAKT